MRWTRWEEEEEKRNAKLQTKNHVVKKLACNEKSFQWNFGLTWT
jgi:hypothetical protein